MRPYLSNSTEAARGLRELGAAWECSGARSGDATLLSRGKELLAEAEELERDVRRAIDRSLLAEPSPPCPPASAGAKEPFHVAVARDPLDPRFRSYRAWMEMLYSGDLRREDVLAIVRYRTARRDTLLGIPTAYGYGSREMAPFLPYGHGFGLIQHDLVREFLLLLRSIAAHGYTRGSWTAPETRNLDPKKLAATR